MKKLRGGRRYFRALAARAESFHIDLPETSWYDLWHTHFDLNGFGRRSPRHRYPHVAALFTAFGRVLDQAKEAKRPLQVFVSIAPAAECEQDALYIHTPNQNGTAFPYQFKGVVWDVKPPEIVRPHISNNKWRVGRLMNNNQIWWIIVPKEYVI
jgi:hypothetical protein